MLGTNVSYKGQVTIPKDVRDALHIRKGDKVYFVADGDRAIMVPIRGDFWSLRGSLKKYARGKSLSWKTIRDQMHKSRAERHMRIVGKSEEAE